MLKIIWFYSEHRSAINLPTEASNIRSYSFGRIRNSLCFCTYQSPLFQWQHWNRKTALCMFSELILTPCRDVLGSSQNPFSASDHEFMMRCALCNVNTEALTHSWGVHIVNNLNQSMKWPLTQHWLVGLGTWHHLLFNFWSETNVYCEKSMPFNSETKATCLPLVQGNRFKSALVFWPKCVFLLIHFKL